MTNEESADARRRIDGRRGPIAVAVRFVTIPACCFVAVSLASASDDAPARQAGLVEEVVAFAGLLASVCAAAWVIGATFRTWRYRSGGVGASGGYDPRPARPSRTWSGWVFLVVFWVVAATVVSGTISQVVLRGSEVFERSLDAVVRDDAVRRRLGDRLSSGRLIHGRLRGNPTGGAARLSYAVRGERGEATVCVSAGIVDGGWRFERVRVLPSDGGGPVDVVVDPFAGRAGESSAAPERAYRDGVSVHATFVLSESTPCAEATPR